MNTRARIAVGLCSLALATAGCSGSVTVGSTPKVSKETVQEQISTQLQGQIGKAPDSVTCPEDLEAKTDATVRCSLTEAGETYGVNVKVTSVENDQAKFDITVDDAPSG